jgi:hypothetical protein
MPRRNLRWTITALVAICVAFVALGGPATAKKFIDGGDIKPGTVGGRQIANGAISVRKLSRRARRALAGRTGPAGATGPQGVAGAPGATGARGPAGAFRLIDQNGTVVGDFVGLVSGAYPQVLTDAGVILTYDNDPATGNALTLATPILYYQQAGCAGPAYGTNAPYSFDLGIVLQNPPSPGSQIYKLVPGTPQSFTAASERTRTGCAASTTRVAGVFEAQPAGTVPAVVKPLRLQRVG